MERFRRYGFCAVTEKWVPRDEMVGGTFKVYRKDGSEHRVPIRLSAEGMDTLTERMVALAWSNDLKTAEELGLWAEAELGN